MALRGRRSWKVGHRTFDRGNMWGAGMASGHLFLLEDSGRAQQHYSICYHYRLSNSSCDSSFAPAHWSCCWCRPHDFPPIRGCPAHETHHRTSLVPPFHWTRLQRLPFFHRHRWPRWVSGNQHTVRAREVSDGCILSLSTPYSHSHYQPTRGVPSVHI